MLRALGLDGGSGIVLAAGRYGAWLNGEQLEHVAFATGPLLQPRPGQNRWRADTPSPRVRASVWLWCQLTSGHERRLLLLRSSG